MTRLALARRACGVAVLTLGCALPLAAQTPRDYAIDLAASVTSEVPRITLSWTQRRQSEITAQTIYRRLKGAASWTQLATLTTTQTGYIDSNALAGVEYEYRMRRAYTTSPGVGMGYLSAGLEVPFVESRGVLLLVVDDTMTNALAPEITQLRADLAGDGWTVQMLTALRSATAATVKAQIKAVYDADPGNVKMVYLLGHVPVPYSGQITPDGHSGTGGHTGAWPADGYYGEMNSTWTDSTVNNTTAGDSRNHNIPGDGKFDQSTLPSSVELMVGRVDLHSMNQAPSAAVGESALLRRYLRKAHDFRHKQGAYANIARRTLIRDGFGYFSGEVFAITGWGWAFTSVGSPLATPIIVEAPASQWFTPTYASGNSYLLGYGCGGGSWSYAGNMGVSADFGRKASGAVFTSQFGSYFGDWDHADGLLRAPLAGTATGDSLGLCCFWGGRPNWFMHHTGMGETIGYGARLTMNASPLSYEPRGNSGSGVHLGLLGDPALRLHVVAPPRQLAAASANSQIELRWAAPQESDLLGYLVYRAATPEGPFTRLTAALQTATNYSDSGVSAGQSYSYLVRSLKLERTPGGSYSNLSVGASVTLTAQAAASAAPRNPTALTVTITAATNALLTWADNADDEGGFRIERRLNAGGAYAAVGTAAANAAAFADAGPFTQGNVYAYRVVATNAAGDSPFSPEVSADAVAGYFDFNDTKTKVNKNAGSAVIAVNRFGGAVGAVSVNYASSNWTATNNTHYTAASGTLTWSDGETNAKSISVPLINTASAQQPREFRLTLSAPTGGGALAVATRLAVLIEDPTATLAAPWAQVQLGTITDGSPAVSAEGGLGSAVMGGSGVAASSTSEAGRFIYRNRSGDSVLTAFFPNGVPSGDGTVRCAVMARATTANNAIMAAAVASDTTGYGAKLAYRSTVGGSGVVAPSSSNNTYRLPRWMRLIRVGNLFTAETSPDQVAWTTLGSVTLSSMPADVQWGIFHYAPDWASSTTYLGDYYLAFAQQVTLTEWPPLPPSAPPAPLTFAAAPVFGAGALLQWGDTASESGYQLERRTADGVFAPLVVLAADTTSYADSGVLASLSYVYRLRATNVVGVSEWVTIDLPRQEHPLPYRESFESFFPDFLLPGFEGWAGDTADAAVVSTNDARLAGLRAYANPIGLPLRQEAHEQVAVFDSQVTNRFAAPVQTVIWSDLMLQATRMESLPAVSSDTHCALCLDADGYLNVWHRDLAAGSNRWSAVAWQTANSTQWARVTLQLDYATADTLHNARYFRFFMDGAVQSNSLAWSANDGSGVPGGDWFAMALTSPASRMSALLFLGGGALDDLVVDTARPLIGLGPHGTPEWWLADQGLTNGNSLAANELEDADNDRFPNWKEREAFTDPNDPESLLRVTALAEPLANGRLPLTLQTIPGQRYTLQGSTNLVANLWEEVPFSLTPEGTPEVQSVTAPETTLLLYVAPDAPLRFYRVTLVP